MITIRAIAIWFDARRRLMTLVLVGWAALIVIASGDAPPGDETFVLPDLGDVLVIVGALAALISLALIVFLRLRPPSGPAARRVQTLRAWVLLVIVIVFFALAVGPRELEEAEGPLEPEVVPTAQQGQTGGADDSNTETNQTEVTVLIVLGVLAGAVLLSTRRSAGNTTAEVVAEHDALLDSEIGPMIDEVTRRLRTGSEPRMAVMAAYASLEDALTDRGQRRGHAETPSEHMARVLASVPTLTRPAVRLGRLYALARFSDHPISDRDRDRAAADLTHARQTLEATAGES